MLMKGLIYLFTGKLNERKGIMLLLTAWMVHVMKYPNDNLVVVGSGELYDVCNNIYGKVPSVYIEGAVPYESIYKYYAIADVYVLPTIEDNWSLVVPKAMSCGLPIATSIYNGCHKELVHDGENVITFDTFSQESLVKAFDYFHQVDLKRMGEKSIEIEKIYNTDNSAKREYKGILKGLK